MRRWIPICAASLLVGMIVASVSGAFGASNAGTFNMAGNTHLGVSCPNSLSNSNVSPNGETLNCAAATTTTTVASTTTTVPAPTTTVPVTTTTLPSGSGGGTCTNPIFTTSEATGTVSLDDAGLWWVDNDAWNGSHGPQTLSVCDQTSWTALSDQTDNQGQVETYPNSEYDVGGRNSGPSTVPISAYQSITSTFSEQFPTDGSMDAAYDLWLNNWTTEIMVWNEVSGTNAYWLTQGTPVVVGGVAYQFVNLGDEFIFIMANQAKSGTVDLLAPLQYLVAQNLVKASDAPTQLEYGAEISATNGPESFPLTGLTFNLS